MRESPPRKNEAVLKFESNDDGLPKVVRDYRERYRVISQVLDDNPEILAAIHRDLLKLSEGDSQGREGDYTSENIFRSLIVQHLEGLPFRETVIRIGSDSFLQDFARMRKRPVMDYSFLDKCFLAVEPKTWKHINELLGQYGVAEDMVHTNVIRTDTTVVESNIHHPTDASLLWDTWRVTSRLLKQAMEIVPGCCPHRLHDRKTKRLYLYVTRYMPSKSESRQRTVKASFRTLIERTEWIVTVAEEFCAVQAGSRGGSALAAVALELKAYLPAMKKVVAAARRSQIEGETVPASQRVFSLFEPHTELVKRGRRHKPVEFGHKVLLCESRREVHHRLQSLRETGSGLRLDGVGHPASRETFRRASRGVGGGQGLLPGRGEVCRIGRAGGYAGDTSADARFYGQGVGALASVSGGDRGDYFRSETAPFG